jgi:hypothetical protein
MIIRVLSDAQYRLDDAAFAAVHSIDDRVQAAAEAGDPDAFAAALTELVVAIQEHGEPLAPDEFLPSDAMVPSADTTLEEAQSLLGDEGLVPNTKA